MHIKYPHPQIITTEVQHYSHYINNWVGGEAAEKLSTLLINSGRFYFALDLLLFLRIFSCGVIPSVMTVIRLTRDGYNALVLGMFG